MKVTQFPLDILHSDKLDTEQVIALVNKALEVAEICTVNQDWAEEMAGTYRAQYESDMQYYIDCPECGKVHRKLEFMFEGVKVICFSEVRDIVRKWCRRMNDTYCRKGSSFEEHVKYLVEKHTIMEVLNIHLTKLQLSKIKAIMENYGVEVRQCDACHNLFDAGYYAEDTYYYCSDECLHTKYTPEEWSNLCSEDGTLTEGECSDSNYYTEWE